MGDQERAALHFRCNLQLLAMKAAAHLQRERGAAYQASCSLAMRRSSCPLGARTRWQNNASGSACHSWLGDEDLNAIAVRWVLHYSTVDGWRRYYA